MTISRPCYPTREDVKRALDIKTTARLDWQIDQAIEGASENIDAHMHRQFYPEDKTCSWDWPNFQRAYPWRIWFDKNELADVTVNVPVVKTGGTVIPNSAIFWGHPNYSPPFTYMELDRSQSFSFGVGSTPQRDVTIQGTYGYWLKTRAAGTLDAAISSTSATTAVVSDGSLVGVGDLLIAGSERMIVTGRATAGTGQTISSGGTTNVQSDNAITVADGTQVHAGEVIAIGSERMLVVDVTGNVLTVIRGWDGSVLSAHSASDTIYAYRSLTVIRGALGTTAATHSQGDAATISLVPTLIKKLGIAEACNTVLQEIGGYTDPQGESGAQVSGIGSALADLWDEAETAYGRKLRQRVV